MRTLLLFYALNIHASVWKSVNFASGSVNMHRVCAHAVFPRGSYQPVSPHPASTGPGSAAITVLMGEKEREHGGKKSELSADLKQNILSSTSSVKTLGPSRPEQRAIWIFKQKNRMECINQAVVNV